MSNSVLLFLSFKSPTLRMLPVPRMLAVLTCSWPHVALEVATGVAVKCGAG